MVPVEVSLWTMRDALGRTRSISRVELGEVEGPAPLDGELGHLGADAHHDLAHRARRTRPATITSTRSPGSITDSAPASSAVRPEPGMTMTSLRGVWKTSRRARVVGSSTFTSKFWSYWMVGRLIHGLDDGQGSSVGPGDHQDRARLRHCPS